MPVHELSHVFENGMPHFVAIPPFLHLFQRRLGDVVRPGGVSVAADILVTSLHAGTHIDAFSHVADEHHLTDAGASGEHLPALLTRGVLLDCRAAVDSGAHELGPDVLEQALADKGTALQPGDVALLATGWERRWSTPGAYSGPGSDPPGIDVAAATMLADAGVVAVAADTPTVEPASTRLGVHRELLWRRRVYLLENLSLSGLCDEGVAEVLFLALPLRIAGATGSPVRCLAVTGAGLAETLAFFRAQVALPVPERP